MIGFLLRRFRWMLLGAGVRYVARQTAGRSIDRATADLEERLPDSVTRVVEALPGDLLRAGGAATVSARAARQTSVASARVGRGAARWSARAAGVVPEGRRRLRHRISAARFEFDEATETARRELKSDYARHFEGESAALEALLDLRNVEEEPIPEVPAPIPTGRRRFRRPPPPAPVARVQRTYKRPVKAWDRRSLPSRRAISAPDASDR